MDFSSIRPSSWNGVGAIAKVPAAWAVSFIVIPFSLPVIPGRCEASNPESRDSPMRNCASEVWSFGPSRNDSLESVRFLLRRVQRLVECRIVGVALGAAAVESRLVRHVERRAALQALDQVG